MSKAEDLQKYSKKVASFFNIPTEQVTVKEIFTCTLKGSVNATGRLFLAPSFICFIGQGFKKSSRYWAISDLLDLATEGKSLRIMAVDGKAAIFSGFVDGVEGCAKCLRAMKRVLYGMNGNSILHAAVDDLDFVKVKQILQHDPTRLNEVNRFAQTPLIIACVKNDIAMVNTLLDVYSKGNVDINLLVKGYHVLHSITAIAGMDDKILTTILNFPGINITAQVTHDKTTPLHYFCANSGSVDCMAIGEVFFKHGAKANAVTLQNETPLHKAIFNKKVRVLMVQMMLRNNADPNIKAGVDGDTPLFYAIRLKRKDLVECLLGEGGANIELTNNLGFNALQIATQEHERSDATEKPVCLEIIELIQNVKQLNEFLKAVDLLELSKKFIMEGFHEPSTLCQLDEVVLKEMGIVKIGTRLKILKELENFKAKYRQSERDKKDKKMQQLLQKGGHHIDAALIRETLNLEAGKWEIESNEIEFCMKLGAGAAGQVFKGLYKGHEVAIKVLNQTSNFDNELDEFRKEFEILRKVNDPHMIQFYGAVIDKNLCMVMELCDKGSLHDLLKKKDFRLTWDLAIKFALDMAEGISVLHNHSPPIIHRDLKSLNLLVTKNWDVKLCDFGLSRLVQGDLKTFTRLCGTYAYIAPELFKGSPASAKSDIFSMGIVLWELINSAIKGYYEQPYDEYNFTMDVQIIVQTAEGLRPTIPDGSPMDFVEILESCTVGDPQQRSTAIQVVQKIGIMKDNFSKNQEAWLSRRPYLSKKTPTTLPQKVQQAAGSFKGWGKRSEGVIVPKPPNVEIQDHPSGPPQPVQRRHSGSLEGPTSSPSVKKLREGARPRRSSEVPAVKPKSGSNNSSPIKKDTPEDLEKRPSTSRSGLKRSNPAAPIETVPREDNLETRKSQNQIITTGRRSNPTPESSPVRSIDLHKVKRENSDKKGGYLFESKTDRSDLRSSSSSKSEHSSLRSSEGNIRVSARGPLQSSKEKQKDIPGKDLSTTS